MTDRNHSKKHSSAPKYIKGIFVILLTAAWLAFVIFYWQQRDPFFRMSDAAYIPWLRNRLDPSYFYAVSAYLHVAPLIFLFYLLSVKLPEASADISGITAVLIRIMSALLMITGVLAGISCCTTLPEYFKNYIPAIQTDLLVYYCDQIYLHITPVCLILSLLFSLISISRKRAHHSGFGYAALSFLVSILFGVMIAAASCLVLTALKPVLPALSAQMENFCTLLASSSSMFVIAVILAPLIEETVFRGLIQHYLSACFNPAAAVILASAAFGLWHRNLGQFIYTFLFGLITGSVYEITGRLHHCILIHFIMNLTAVLAFSNAGTGIIGTLPQAVAIRQYLMSRTPLTAAVFGLLLFAAMIVMLIILNRQKPADHF